MTVHNEESMLKGAMHAHSTYSDGEFTLAELRRVFLEEGCAFVCMTDHAEHFAPDQLSQYIAECQALPLSLRSNGSGAETRNFGWEAQIEKIVGHPIEHFSCPGGRYDRRTLQMATPRWIRNRC